MMQAEVYGRGATADLLEQDALAKAAPFWQARLDNGIWYLPGNFSYRLAIVEATVASRENVVTNYDGAEVSAGWWTAQFVIGLEKIQ